MGASPNDPSSWREALRGSPYPLDDEGATKLGAYVEALQASARAPNLTALDSVARISEVLVRPSMLMAWAVDAPPTRIADIGTGNGFPGIVAAALWPDAKVCLVERRVRKAAAVSTLARDAGFDVEVIACDVRELSREAPGWMAACDLVTLRAVGPLGPTTRLAAPLLAPGGCLAHWKADDLDPSERAEGDRVAQALGLTPWGDTVQPALATARLVRYGAPR